MKVRKTTKAMLRKAFAGILSVAMMIGMLLSLTVGVSAADANQKVMEAKNGVLQIQTWFVDEETGLSLYLSYGTGFLINEDTIITCDHVATGFPDEFYADWTRETNKEYNLNRTVAEVKSMLQLRVTVDRDVWVSASVRKASSDMDFAILTLDEKIHNREILPLRSSSTLNQTEAVYALGFPGDLDSIMEEHTYGVDAVTVTTGNVNQVAKMTFVSGGLFENKYFDNVEFIEHSALIAGGNSGGPLVDANGAVVGVNSSGSNTRNLAISIDQVISTLDALGIEYQEYGVSEPAPQPVEPTENDNQDETETTKKPAATDDEDDNDKESRRSTDEEEGFFDNSTNIILVAVAAVVLILVIVIIAVVSSGKKKKEPAAAAPAAPAAPRPVTPPAGYGPSAGAAPHAPGGFVAAQPRPQPMGGFAAPAPAPQQEAGETTVLNQGAGETTLLSRKVNGGTLVRKKNGESVVISSEHFIIGRERKKVDYCISDNTSISRSHAKLLVKNGSTYLVDMGAANGTYVNGVKAEPRHEIQLKNGDKITLADEDLEFRI